MMKHTMTTRQRRWPGLALALLMLAAVPVAQAVPTHDHHGIMAQASQLQLTDEQRQQIRKITRSARNANKHLRDALADNREAMRRLDPGDSNYQKQLEKLASDKAALVKKLTIQRGKMKARVYALLTPEQRKKAATMAHQRPLKGATRDLRSCPPLPVR